MGHEFEPRRRNSIQFSKVILQLATSSFSLSSESLAIAAAFLTLSQDIAPMEPEMEKLADVPMEAASAVEEVGFIEIKAPSCWSAGPECRNSA